MESLPSSTIRRSRYAAIAHVPTLTNLADLYGPTLRRTNRKNTSLDYICYPRSPHLSSLRWPILESSQGRTICLQEPQTQEARKRESIRSTHWNLFSRAEGVYIQGVHPEHAAENTTLGIQCYSIDGYNGARILCQFWIPDYKLFCSLQV